MIGVKPWPTELRVMEQGRLLSVTFEDGSRFDLSAEYLRVESPSAEVQGHSRAGRKWVGGKQNVRISAVTPIGNYAVRLAFDDGHDSGIYSWAYLRRLGDDRELIWAAYLAGLASQGTAR